MNDRSEACQFEVYWPRAARRGASKKLATRLASLKGKRVAFLWDYLFRGDDIYEVVEKALRERFADISFMGWREIGNIHSSDERQMVAALPARLKAAGVDAVITSVAA